MALEDYEDLLNRKRAVLGGKRMGPAKQVRTRPERDFIQKRRDKSKFSTRKM